MKILTAAQILADATAFLQVHAHKKVVIDLDSTLYNVSGRQIKIFQEFAAVPTFQKRFPKETKALQNISGDKLAYYPVDCLRQIGVTEIHPDFASIYHDFWGPRFFSHKYLQYDTIEPGAHDFINTLERQGFSVVFLTGRDVPRMGEGTVQQLQRDQLLVNQRQLILKPHLSEEDHLFKLRIATQLCSQQDTGLLFIDNEAKNLNYIYQASLPVFCVFFDTVHSGKAEPLSTLAAMQSFVL